jgi:hypothetical protein
MLQQLAQIAFDDDTNKVAKHTKQVDVDFLQCVNGAKLIHLVMHLVEYQWTIVLHRVILHDIVNCKTKRISSSTTIHHQPLDADKMLTTSIRSK